MTSAKKNKTNTTGAPQVQIPACLCETPEEVEKREKYQKAEEAAAIWPEDSQLDITEYSKNLVNQGTEDQFTESLVRMFGKYGYPHNALSKIFLVGCLYKRNDLKIPDWAKAGAHTYVTTHEDTAIPYNYAFKSGDVILITSEPEVEKPWQNVLVVHNNARARLYVTEDVLAYWDLVSEPELAKK